MRTVRIRLYKIYELKEPAKKKAIEWYRNTNTEIFWADENEGSMKAFVDVFPINVTRWGYGDRNEGVIYRFTCDNEIIELKGQRLATYIWNNYRTEIYSRKYYSYKAVTTEPMKHPRIKSVVLKGGGPNAGKYSNSYHSGVLPLESYNCPLTGYTMDNEILDEVWKFLAKPDDRDFRDLLDDCFNAWVKACNADIEDQNTDDYIQLHLQSNEYEFTREGKVYP